MAVIFSDSLKAGVPGPLDGKYLYQNLNSKLYLPYSSTSSACSTILPSVRSVGLTVLIGTSSTQPYPQEYWWQNGTSDSDLVLKQSLATGNITGSASTGYVTIWTGTTSVGYDQSLSFNKGNPNGLLVGSSSYTYLSGSYGLQVNNDTYIGGKIFVNSNLPGNNGLSASAISTNGGIYAQNYILGAGGIGILNGFQNGFTRGNSIQTTAFGTSSITGLVVQTSGTYSNLGLTANNIGIYVKPQISGGGFFLNTIGAQIVTIDTPYSTHTSNWTSLLIGGIIPSGNWGIYNSDPSSNYLASDLLIGYTQSQGTYSLETANDILVNGIYIGLGNPGKNYLNLAIGVNSLISTYYNIGYNTAIGNYTLYSNTIGVHNTALGYFSLYSNTTGVENISIGSSALYFNTIGNYNTAVGASALNNNISGIFNVSIGNTSLLNNNGNYNTCIGGNSGRSITSGSNNTIIGSYHGISDMNNNIVLSDGQGNISYQWDGTNNILTGPVLIGYAQSQGSYNLQVSGSAYFSQNISASGSITAQTGGFDSDLRLKSNIVYNPKIEGIDSIKSASYIIGGNSHIGYIAQDVEGIVPSSIIKKDDGYLALNYNEVLVAKVAYLENKVKELYDIIERNGLK